MSKKEEKAYEYSKKISNINPKIKDFVECSFMVDWDCGLRNQFRKCIDNKPQKGEEPKEGENVILLCQMVGGSNDGFIFQKVNTFKNGDWESKMLMRYNVIAWMPIPPFDEILKENKDVLKRLKAK